jgi:hypothetical protein
LIASIYEAHIAADRAWLVQIALAFPMEWPGELRHTQRAKGEPGTRLRAAYERFIETRDEWEAAHAALDPEVREVLPLKPR